MNSSELISLRPLKLSGLKTFRCLLGCDDFGGCFCAVWSSYDEDWVKRCKDPTQPNFIVTKRNIEEGKHVGYFVYQGDDLVGWTGSGRKSSFPLLNTKLGSRLSESPETTWSIGCLSVLEKFRGKGISDRVVTAIIEEARKDKAKILEAYPTRPWHEPRSYRGGHQLYERMGFKEKTNERDDEFEILLMQFSLEEGK